MGVFCPVMPIHIAKAFKDQDKIGIHHLLLAHDVVAHAKEYAEVFGSMTAPHRHIILDNSVVELGTAVDGGMVKEAADICKPTCIVLPDVYQDSRGTIQSVRKHIDAWYNSMIASYAGVRDFMYLPQGTNKHEFAICAEAFGQDPRIRWWGIPRNYCVQGIGSRVEALRICAMVNGGRSVHMFGFSDDFVDDFISANHPNVVSIDSAVPIRCASLGLRFSLGLGPLLPPRGNWWEEASAKDIDLMIENVQIAQSYAHSGLR